MPAKVDLQISGIVGIHQIGVCACVSIECWCGRTCQATSAAKNSPLGSAATRFGTQPPTRTSCDGDGDASGKCGGKVARWLAGFMWLAEASCGSLSGLCHLTKRWHLCALVVRLMHNRRFDLMEKMNFTSCALRFFIVWRWQTNFHECENCLPVGRDCVRVWEDGDGQGSVAKAFNEPFFTLVAANRNSKL